MKNIILIGMFAVAFAGVTEAHAMTLPEGCGNASVQFKVKTSKKQPAPDTAPAGSAQLVFVQSLAGDFENSPITRFAVDGSWIGANKGASYFVVNVTPGKHEICAARQSGIQLERDNVGTLSVDAVAGKTYFYDFKISRNEVGAASGHAAGQLLGYATPDMTAKRKDTIDTAELKPLDTAPGLERTRSSAVSTATPK